MKMKLLVFSCLFMLVNCKSTGVDEIYKDTPVIQAILNKGNLAKVQAAVEKGGSVNEVQATYATSALQYAVYNILPRSEQIAVVSYLLQKGADLSHTDSTVRNVFAEIFANVRHADSNYTDQEKISLFESALAGGMNVNFREKTFGNSPLIIVVIDSLAANKASPILALLMEKGADPDYKNTKGESARSLIEAKANKELKDTFFFLLKSKEKKNLKKSK